MQRQRKKDLNLKPNRVLDKRSSRGMIYENEELRMRTLSIADDVDRGQSDIRKLRKENEHLKREIWALRDELEKLEELVKKVNSGNLNPNDLPYPELFLETDNLDNYGSLSGSRKGSFDVDADDMGLMRTMFLIDDDTGTVIEVEPYQNQNIPNQPQEGFESSDDPSKFGKHLNHPRFVGVSPDLEAVKEESESIQSQSCQDLAMSPLTVSVSPDLELPSPDNELVDLQYIDEAVLNSPTPVIHITPASSPSAFSSNDNDKIYSPSDTPPVKSGPGQEGDEIEKEPLTEGGCITDVPKTYQVTSQIHIEERPLQDESRVVTSIPTKLRSLPPLSPKASASKVSKHKRNTSSTETYQHRHCLHNTTEDSKLVPLSSFNLLKTGAHEGNPGVGNFVVNQFCPSCYQSEPSLTSAMNADDYFNQVSKGRPLTFDPLLCYPNSLGSYYKSSWWFNIDKNLVVGYVDDDSVVIRSQDIVDELESRFDPTLEKVKGIRVLARRVFLCLKDQQSVNSVLDAFGSKGKGFAVRNSYTITFVDGSQGYSKVKLSGVGAQVSDDTVVSVLNQYGQVVGAVERPSYKGVDIWERGVRLHIAKPLPLALIIGGYDVTIQYQQNQDAKSCQLPVNESNILNTSNRDITECSPVIEANSFPVTCQIHQLPVTSQIQHPTTSTAVQQVTGEELNSHKAVSRSCSSNPRLELGPSPTSPVPTPKRQPSASVCTATLLPDEHPGRLFQKNPNLLKTCSPNTPGSNLLPPSPKKPLSRLLKSSPGSLVAPTSAISTVTNQTSPTRSKIEVPENIESQEPSPTSAFRAAFYRKLSIDPRRGSTTSQMTTLGMENNNVGDKLYSRRGSSNVFHGRFANQQNHHQPLSQMNSNSSSQFDNSNSSRKFGNSVVNTEPLPWCGCWGNGCI